MSAIRTWLAEGTSQRWLAGAALLIALAMITGLVAVVVDVAAAFFWPKPIVALTLADGRRLLGQEAGREADPGSPGRERVRMNVGNRDLTSVDFVWVRDSEVHGRRLDPDAWQLERREYGAFFGTPVRTEIGGVSIPAGVPGFVSIVRQEVDRCAALLDRRRQLLRRLDHDHAPVARLQARVSSAQRRGVDATSLRAALEKAQAREGELNAPALTGLVEVDHQLAAGTLTMRTGDGREAAIPIAKIVRVVPANALTTAQKLALYFSRWWEFLSGEPRESNTEGGIFPALFGTALMVLLMTVVVVPLGVVTAVYLNEYAREGVFTKAVRLALANLAGVPSIVFGAFGLAFLVYTVGSGIDRAFFANTLPTPTFGTGGILWASLTLALLTVPVVVIATEEGLQAVPQAVRDGARALGATRAQTLRRVVLPYALPGILTGTILAVARGAGEVAPLMLTGVVKLAPDLPLDRIPPFLHLDRKFMHLGFHIYDVGFQSPNVEAAKPMVYATVLVLLFLVVVLNITAIVLRNRLRRKLRSSAV
jgi:phosphate transport system permease protein